MKGFTDYNFYIYFFILFLFYWFTNSKLKQNYFILIFGYFFYYSIDSKFFLLLIGFTLSTFLIANIIHKSKEQHKKKITIFSITFFILLLLSYPTIFYFSHLFPFLWLELGFYPSFLLLLLFIFIFNKIKNEFIINNLVYL